jgi:hypothetical protein
MQQLISIKDSRHDWGKGGGVGEAMTADHEYFAAKAQ